MVKLAVVDLDGVVANNAERFARATKPDSTINWKIAFTPELVALDTLIPGADKAVKNLEKHGYIPIFLTSRPESMREATQTWLDQHDLDGYELAMKPANMQFVKTFKWKADEVARMASLPVVESALFIDDEANNVAAVEALGLGVVCASSLDEYIPQDSPIIL